MKLARKLSQNLASFCRQGNWDAAAAAILVEAVDLFVPRPYLDNERLRTLLALQNLAPIGQKPPAMSAFGEKLSGPE
jgi:hypothetical protein